LQLALPPFGGPPLAVLRGVFLDVRKHMLVAFVRLTTALRRGGDETHAR
jgi:hypothetical protein